jgi:hypothetical protein
MTVRLGKACGLFALTVAVAATMTAACGGESNDGGVGDTSNAGRPASTPAASSTAQSTQPKATEATDTAADKDIASKAQLGWSDFARDHAEAFAAPA